MRKLKRTPITYLLLMILPVWAQAQDLVKVSGVISSADDSLPLMGVAVMAGPGIDTILHENQVILHSFLLYL